MWGQWARQMNSCSSGYQYYACSKSNYHGCCSVDPCDSGTCPDGQEQPTVTTNRYTITINRRDTTEYSTTTITLSDSPTTSDSTTTSTTDASTSLGSSTTTSTDSSDTSSDTTTSAIATSAPSQTPQRSASSGSHGGSLAGVIIGGLAAAALLALFVFCCWRKEKWRRRILSLSTWRVGRHKRGVGDNEPEDTGDNLAVPQGGGDPFAEFGGEDESLMEKTR
jgi:cobalamin biosynthesis Mg chelatase CobN